MQNYLNKIIKNARKIFSKYFYYVLLLIFAYAAGDKQLFNETFEKLTLILPRQISTKFDTPSIEGESQVRLQDNDKIYYIGKFRVTRIVDGDTLHVAGASAENQEVVDDVVRIMAVDTLEMTEKDKTKLCFAKKQTQFTKNNLSDKEIYLYADKTQGERDKYKRILAYVATSSQNILEDYKENYFYNDYLVDTGNADTYKANPPAVLWQRLENKKSFAKDKILGMWSGDCD